MSFFRIEDVDLKVDQEHISEEIEVNKNASYRSNFLDKRNPLIDHDEISDSIIDQIEPKNIGNSQECAKY